MASTECSIDKINVAVVGYGYWGPNLVRNFNNHPSIDIKYICDLNERNLKNALAHYPNIEQERDYKNLLAVRNIDAAILAVPTEYHFPIGKDFLNHGKHIFVEKPFASNPDEAEELLAIAAKKKLHTFVDHPYVYSEPIKWIKQQIDTEELGKLLYYSSSRINLGRFQQRVNVVADLIPHDLSILDYLLDGKQPMVVDGFGSTHLGNTLERATIHLEYDQNFIADIELSWIAPLKIRQIMLVGDKKMISFDDIQPSEKVRIYDKGAEVGETEGTAFNPYYRDGNILIPKLPQIETLANVVEGFVSSIYTNKPAINNGESGLRVVKLIEQIQKSLQKKY